MANEKFYPSLSTLIPSESLPENLGFLQGISDNIFENFFYKNLQTNVSRSGDRANYTLTLISYNKIGFEIPGTGFALVFNPNTIPENGSEIPITISYKWEILRYVHDFNPSQFDGSSNSFFNLICKIANINSNDIVKEIANVFIGGASPIDTFINNYNSNHTSNQITVTSDTDIDIYVQNVIDAFDAQSINPLQIVFEDYIVDTDQAVLFKNVEKLFFRWLGFFSIERIKVLLTPEIQASINELTVGLQFPASVFRQVNPITFEPLKDSNNNDVPSILQFDIGRILYNTKTGLEFENESAFTFPTSEILSSGFIINFSGLKLDLSRKKNIPEAISDGRPDDFIGAYVKEAAVAFPKFWGHEEDTSTAVLKGRNLLIGTGGISGTVGMEAKTSGHPSPLIKVKFGNFQVSLDAFSLTFHQNSIVASDIAGTLKVNGFKDASNQDAEIRIRIHIGKNGEFSIVAQENEGIVLKIPDVLAFTVKELAIGKKDDHYFIGVSGNLSFIGTGVASALPKDVEIKKLVIWDTGKIELQGGTITLAKPISLKLGPANLSITAIGFGSDERYKGATLRKYNYFEFAAGLSVKPGGVDARGDGIKFYYSVDNGPFDFFIRIESIKVDLIIPGSADEKDATLLIKGYLSMKPAAPPDTGDEYIGGVAFSMPKSGLGGSVAMRMIPSVPSFLVDVEIDLPSPIIIFSGVGIYGFRGLFGQKYLASREAPALAAAGLKPDGEWYQYYKLKVAPDFKEGIQVSKFARRDGFSIGLGASIATAGDGGKTFSSKVFFMVSLPGVFLLQGQAAILRERIKITDTTDPPFSLLLVITKESLTADFGVNYKIPEDTGQILKLNALMEMGFFFKTPNAWYINVGRDLPETKRVTGRILSLFDVYSYLMFSGTGIKAGAGASFAQSYSAGPLKADLKVYLDVAGRINFKPVQIGAAISFGGSVTLSIFKVKVGLSASLTLAGEVPHPFFISGSLKACIKVLKKDRCITIQFTWIFDNVPNRTEIPLFNPDKAIKAKNVLTQETYNLLLVSGSLPANANAVTDAYTIPLDSYVDIEFLKPISGTPGGPGIDKIGGAIAVNSSDQVPQKAGKLPPVRHDFTLEKLSIKHWDSTSNSWKTFDVYDALTPLSIPGISVKKPANPKHAYWQFDTATNKINRLSVLAMSPLEYMRNASKFIPTENLGVTSSDLFCPPPLKDKVCVDFNETEGTKFLKDKLNAQDDLMFRLIGADGSIQEIKNPFGFDNGLVLEPGSSMEIYFPEPVALAELTMLMSTEGMSVSYYASTLLPEMDANGISLKGYTLIKKVIPSISDLVEPLVYEDEEKPIDKIVIEAGVCANTPVTCKMTGESTDLEMLFNTLAQTGKLTNTIPPGIGGAVNLKEEPYASTYNQRLASYKLTNTKHFYYTDNNPSGSDTLHMVIGAPDEGSCVITLTTSNNETILFSQIMSFFNMRPDPDFHVSGANYRFLVDVAVLDQTYTLKGHSTCYPMAICHGGSLDHKKEVCVEVKRLIEKLEERITVLTREKIVSEEICRVHSEGDCSSIGNIHCIIATHIETEIITITEKIVTLTEYTETQCTLVDDGGGVTNPCAAYIFKVCRMKKSDYTYNKTVPDDKKVAVETSAMLDALSNSLQPIWRPDTIYGIELETKDAVSGGDPYVKTYSYLFRTAGPVGHFHEKRPEYNALAEDKKDQFRLKSIKDYIDYEKSYPNANGNIINAKPLFYNCPKLLLFFTNPQIYSMYNNFDAYQGLPAVTSKLEAVIKDPIEPVDQPTPLTGDITWVVNEDGIMTQDVQTLNNLMNGPVCTPVTPITNPKGVNVEVDLCGKLKPLKLYNAVYNAVYNNVSNGVHTYSFQTSQYADFTEQVLSYQIKDENGNIKKYAFFDIDKAFEAGTLNPSTGILLAKQIIDGTETDTEPLKEFAQPYDRLIDKAFGLTAINPAVTTEFNMLVDTSTGNPTSGNVLGILISNPEPFNDPKLKKADLENTIQVVTDSTGNTVDPNYTVVFSKDARKAFITHKNSPTDLNITAQQLFIRFRYLEFNGKEYVLNTPTLNQVVVPVDVKAPVTALTAADCGKTNVALDDTLQATLVTGAIGYEFKIEHAASSFSVSYTRNSTDGKLPLVEIAGLMYNKTYSVSVRPIISGRLTKFGSVCQVSTKVLAFVIVQPASIQQGQSGLVRVEVQDVNGNIIYEYQDDVTLVADPGSNAVVANNGLVDIVNGVGTILITNDYVETVDLSLEDSENTGLNVNSTSAVTFTVAPATQLVIEDPVDTVQGMQATVTVHARNSFPNEDIDTNFNGTVKLNVTGSAVVANGGIVTIVNGTGTIQVTDNTPETVTLSLEDVGNTGLDVDSTQDIVFAIAAATQFVIADPADSIQGVAVTVTVTARNQFGYIDPNYQNDVTLVASGSATGEGLVNIVNGVGTLQINDTVNETVQLTLSDTQGTGLNVASTQDVVFGIAPATKFVIIDPADSVQGVAVTVTVQAQNQFGTIDTAYQNDVTLVASGSATGEGLVDIVNGVGTLQINDTTPETVQLTLTDTQGTGLNVTSTQDVVFGIAPATKFVIIDPTDSVQGVAVTVTVQAQNNFGTVDTAYQNDVTLVASGSATGGGLVDIVNGVGTKQINDNVNETVQLTLSDTQGTGLNVTSTQDVIFGIAPATKFVIIDPSDSVQGVAVTVTVQAQNQFGTVDTAYQNDVTLVTGGNATGGGLVDIINGVGTKQINDTTVETVQLTLTDTQGTGLNVASTQDVVFGIAPATKFVIIDPSDSVQGTAVTVTVQAQNNFGTIDTAYQNDVTLVTSGNATGGGLVNITNGVGTKSINDNTAETVQLTLSDTEGTGLNVVSTQDVVFAIAPATKFVILNPTDTTVGSTVTVTVQAENNFGLVDPNYQNDVTLNTSGSATGGGLVNIVNGIGTKQISDNVAETVNLTLSDTQGTGLDVTSTQDVIFAVALIFQDTFNVGLFDNILLDAHTPDIGLSWTQLINMNGSSGIKAYGISDRAQPVSVVGFDQGSFYGANVSGGYAYGNYEVEITSLATGAATPIVLGVRVSNTGNDGYFVRFNTTSSQLYKRVGGTWTAVGSAAGGVANNAIAKLQIIGTTLKFFINGTLTITATVTDISATGVAGLGMGRLMIATDDETSIAADNFKVTLV